MCSATECLCRAGNFGRILSKLLCCRGQATIEAAFVIPVLMVLFLLLLQPGIILYDRMVMKGVATEACRLLATSDYSQQSNEDYVRRRLSAIPQVDIFHMHSSGCSYRIDLMGDERSEKVNVTIATEVKPLPLIDVAMGIGGLLNGGGNIEVEVSASMPCQPQWVLSSAGGTDPSGWQL